MNKLFIGMLLLFLPLLTACDNPFEEIKNDIDAIKAIQDVQTEVEQIEALLDKDTPFDAATVKTTLSEINQNIDAILKSDAAVSVIKSEYEGDVVADIEAFKTDPEFINNYNTLDQESKDLIDSIVLKLENAGF